MNGNLSTAQFGQAPTAPAPPQPLRAPERQSSEAGPLSLSGSLGTTASRTTAWRLNGVQPYSKQTMGSTFNFNA